MVEKDRQSDIVDEAFETLRRTQPPEGPSLQALEQTLQAIHQAQRKSNRISLIERIKNMNKFIKYPVAAAIAIAVLIGAACLLLGPHADIAFADVRQQIEQAQTMTMTATVEMKDPSELVIMKIYFKSPGLIRQDVTQEKKAATALGTSQPTASPAVQNMVCIFDFPNNKGVILSPDQKKALLFEPKNVPAGAVPPNPMEKLKEAVAGEHEELGKKTINGQKAKGYRCKSGEGTMDIWADMSTGNPILVEEMLPKGMGKITMTNFVMGTKLDDSLFDTKVPEGYDVKEETSLTIQESDLIKGLSLLAKYCNGVFPKSLMPTPELMKQLKISREERMELAMQLGKPITFQLTMTQSGSECVYAGEGVKFGDKATPILWYKAKNAKTYRVIYGDMHVEDAAKAPKQPASRPAPESP